MIDTHTHYGMDFFKDNKSAIEEADRKAGIVGRICLPITFEDNFTMMQRTDGFSNMYYAVGIHPKRLPILELPEKDERSDGQETDLKKVMRVCRTQKEIYSKAEETLESFRKQLMQIDQLILDNHEKIVAIGETGIDTKTEAGKKNLPIQRISLREHLRMSLKHSLPVILHLRGDNALDEALDVMNSRCFEHCHFRGVLHCFHGTEEDILRINCDGKHDFMFGIGGIITYPERGALLRDTLKNRGRVSGYDDVLSRLLLETDAPFLSPQKVREKFGYQVQNVSAYLTDVVEKLAEVLQIDPEVIIDRTSQNARRLFDNMNL